MRNKLISGLAGAAFSFAASGSAFAQAPPPAPVYNWTGWYVGVNAGASFGRAKTDFNGSPITLTGPSSAGPVVTSPIPGVGGSNTEYPDGFMGGGQPRPGGRSTRTPVSPTASFAPG
jgi:outer membrane immunogenic protein